MNHTPHLAGPHETFHRQISSLEMRFVRDVSLHPWHPADLIFDEQPWLELYGEQYEPQYQALASLPSMVEHLKNRLSTYDTGVMEAITDGKRFPGFESPHYGSF